MKIRVEVTPASERAVVVHLDKTAKNVDKALFRGIRRSAAHLSSFIKAQKLSGQYLKNRTGTLRRAVHDLMDGGDGVVRVGKEAPYGKFQHEGTKPYSIFPNRKKALRFVIGGRTIFAKKVDHPGLKPKPFMTDALREQRTVIRDMIAAEVGREIR